MQIVNESLEYTFRAKLKHDNRPRKKGEWVYGDLIQCQFGKGFVPAIYGIGDVEESTICAYTNIDIGGKKCFDKDIISVIMHEFGEDPRSVYFQVIFSKRFGMWTVAKADGKVAGASLAAYAVDPRTKIVGNIFDNPELLEV